LALALEPDRVVSEDALIEMLWEGAGGLPANPRNTVQQYVSHLRGALGAASIETVPPGYRLGAAFTSDVVDFERLVALARSRMGQGDSVGARQAIDDALGMWRGPVFGDLGDVEAARGEAARLEQLRVSARELELEIGLAGGWLSEAAASAEALVAEFPLREGPVRALAVARHGLGQEAEALRVIAGFRDRLAGETGLETSRDLADLERRLLEGVPDAVEPMARHVAGYELGELIGEGAFGAIYRAIQPSVGREVAVKVIQPELANDPGFVRRFEVEAQTVARLEHPHIVPLYDFWRDPSGAYLVMRYLAGGSAASGLVQQGPWPVTEVARLVDEIGAALAVAHEAGVVHRDVKPDNILFDESGNSYLADFGIAVDAGIDTEADLASAGSPLYVSPEQVRDGESSPSSDIYAFGVVLFELLTGWAPFGDSDSVRTLLERKLSDRVPSIAAERPDVPSGLDPVIQTATHPDPSRRFPAMSEFVLAFRAACAGALGGFSTAESVPGGDVRPRQAVGRTLVSVELAGVNPYKGLAAFGEADADDFFGRESLVHELVSKADASRFVVVTGPSGSGKSSVVRAGVLPRLRARGSLVVSMTPGAHPMDELETGLLRIATEPLGSLLEQLTADERGLARAVKRVLPDDGSELVLVVDQFEELFIVTPDDRRDWFLEAVAYAVTEERSQLRVITTLRADFYDRPLQHPAVSELVRANTVAVSPLSGEELDAAITGPAARLGVIVEPALVAELVGEVRGNPAALPMLQFALTEGYEQRSAGRMDLDAYHEIGGITGAVANRADELHEALSAEQQDDVRRLFTRLITPGEGTEDTRRRVRRSELETIDQTVIEIYGAARLLTFDHDPATREPTVEVAHEAIIREWPRLRAWLDEDREGLRLLRHVGAAADAWDTSGRDTGELYRGGRLESAEEWVAAHREDFTDLELVFLDASLEHRSRNADAERRRLRRLRALLATTAVIAVLALIAGLAALINANEADDQRAEAEAQTALADAAQGEAESERDAADQARTEAEQSAREVVEANADLTDRNTELLASSLTLRSTVVLPSDPVAAMILASEANSVLDDFSTQGALLNAITARPTLVRNLPALGDTTFVEVSPDGRYAALGAGTDSFVIVDLSTDGVVGGPYELTTSQSFMHPFAFSPDGTILAVIKTRDTTTDPPGPSRLQLYDLATFEQRDKVFTLSGADFYTMQYSASGTEIAVSTGDLGSGAGEVLFLDAETLEETRPRLPTGFGHVAWSPDESLVAHAHGTGEVSVWDPVTGERLGVMPERHDGANLTVRFSPDGTILATAGFGTAIRFWDPLSMTAAAEPLVTGEIPIRVLRFSDDGALLAATGTSGTHIADTRTFSATPMLVSHTGAPWGLSFLPDSHTLIVATPQGAHVWNPDKVGSAGNLSRVIPLDTPSDSSHFAISPDGTAVASMDIGLKAITVRSVDTGETLAHREWPGRTVEQPIFHPSGDWLAVDVQQECVAADDPAAPVHLIHPDARDQNLELVCPGEVQLLDAHSLETVNVVVQRAQPNSADIFNLDAPSMAMAGDRLAVATQRGRMIIEVFDLTTGELVGSPILPPFREGQARFVFVQGFRPGTDGAILFASTNFGDLLIYEFLDSDWVLARELPIAETEFWSRAFFSPDGEIVVRTGITGSVTVHNADTLEVTATLRTDLDNLGDWAFSPDGAVLAGDSGSLKVLYNTATWQRIGDGFTSGDGLSTFLPGSRNMFTIGSNIVITEIDHTTWAGVACEIANRSLSKAEWDRYIAGQQYSETCRG